MGVKHGLKILRLLQKSDVLQEGYVYSPGLGRLWLRGRACVLLSKVLGQDTEPQIVPDVLVGRMYV